uniref:fibronectin type III domain-containing protein n=1 Tax=Flavobacterium sp. TaxID=239 RepID=UPI00404A56C0
MHSNFTMSHWINRVATAFSSSCVTTKKHGYFSLDEKFSKGFLIMMFLIGIVSTTSLQAQTVTIGSGTSTTSGNFLPIAPYYNFSYSQQIIPQASINTTGNISVVRYYWTGNALTNSTNWTIYLGHTTKTSFTSSTDWVQASAMTQVFSGTVTTPASAGWMEITLTTPFIYNNTDNLIIAVDENQINYTGSFSTTYFRTFTGSSNNAIYYRSDSTNPNPASISLSATGRVSQLNQMQFEFTAPPACLFPSALIASAVTSDSATISWTAPASAPSDGYEYEVRTSGAAGSGETGLVDDNTTVAGDVNADISGLTAATTYSFYVRSNCDLDGFSDWSGAGTFTTSLCNPVDQCNYTIEMTDTYDDSWNGGVVAFVQSGVTVATFVLASGASGLIADVALCDGVSTQIIGQTAGSYPNEIGFVVRDITNTIVYTRTPASFTSGTVFTTFTSSCTVPDCLAPLTVNASSITLDSATIAWIAPDPAPDAGYEYEVRTSGAAGSGATGLVDSGSNSAGDVDAAISGLDSNTTYSVYVRSNCGGDVFSDWTTEYNFTTAPACGDTVTGLCYSQTSTEEVLLSFSATPGNWAEIVFLAGELETCCDAVIVYDGLNGTGSVLYTSQLADYSAVGSIVSTTGFISLVIDSDGSVTCGTAGYNSFEVTVNCVTPPDCLVPTLAATTNLTTASATINWVDTDPAASDGFEYEVRTSGAAGSGATGLVDSGSTLAGDVDAVINGLDANTNYSFYIRANCGGSGFSDWSEEGTFTTLKAEPTNQVTNFAAGTVTTTAIPFTWTAAVAGAQAPDGYLIKASDVSLVSISDPVDGTDPANVTAFTAGAANKKQTTGASTSSTSFTGMSAGTMYYYKNYSYTNSGTGIDFNIVNPAEFYHATRPSANTAFVFAASSATEATLSWTQPGTYDNTKHTTLVFVKAATAVTAGTPSGAASAYTASTTFGSGTPFVNDTSAFCVFNGDGNSVDITGLEANTQYHVLVYVVMETANSNGTSSYAAGLSGSGLTLCEPADLFPNAGFRCGPGEVELTATASGGATINWYADAVGGTSLGTGDSFITPTILSSTNFYADVTVDGATTNGGKLAPETSWTTFTTTNYGIVFNVLSAGTLNAVDVYSTSAGTLTVKITDASLNTLFTSSAIAVANGGTTTPTTIPINFDLPVGTGYRILVSSFTGVNLVRGSTSLSFPYTDSNLSVTASEWGGTTTGSYYYFYNLDFTSKCISSPRQAVLAEIGSAPALTLSAAPAAVCAGEDTTAVTITSDVSDFDTYVWSPALGVSGNETTGWTFNTTETTEYTLTASDSGTGCSNIATVTISILPTPTAVVIDNGDATICSNEIQTLTVSGGLVEGAPSTTDSGVISAAIPDNSLTTGVVSNLVVSGVPASATITTIEIGLNITHTFNGDMRINLEGPNGEIINLVNQVAGSGDNFVDLTITSDNTAATLPTSATSNLTGTFKASLANQGTIATTPAVSSTSFSDLFDTPNGIWKLRVYDDAGSDIGTLTNWSITIEYNFGDIVWSPTTGLFTDALATIPYNGTDHASTIYANPSANTTYTATATAGSCSITDTVTFTVDTAPSVSNAGSDQSIIDGDVITLAANNPTVGSGTWSIVSGPSTDVAQFGNATVYNTSFNQNGGMGTYVLRWTITNGVCSDSTSDVSITIEPVKWSGGVWNNVTGPTALLEAEIDGDYVSADDGGSITVKNLTITPTSTLTISTGDVLTVAGALINEATVNDVVIESGAYLHQTSDDANTGSITIKRATNIKRLDISLWSSPVDAQNLLALSPQTLTNRFFGYDEAANNWTIFADVANETMVPAAGYGVRAPNNWPVTLTSFTGVFKGVPNNGDYTQAFTSDHATANYNLVGNPYPSVLDLRAFYTANTGKILNTVYFFEHTITPGTGGGQTNYGTLTIAPDAADNVYVPASSSPNLPNIAAIQAAEAVEVGQGFFVRAVPGESGNLDFNNAMRKTTPGVFFRNATTTLDSENEVTSKFRLQMTSPEGFVNQTVVGYYDYASNDLDMMDAQGIGSPLYTILSGKKLASQGFGLPFNQGQVIPLGGNFEIAGEYSIALHSAQGIFGSSQYVLIHDTVLGIYHNLSLSPYSFEASGGVNDTRFKIVFTSILSSENPDFAGNSVVVYEINDVLQAQVKGNTLLESIQVVDLSGKILFEQAGINTNLYNINTIRRTETILLVTTTTKEGLKQTHKIFY